MERTTRLLILLMLVIIAVLVLPMSIALGEEEDLDLMFVEQPESVELPTFAAEQEDDTPLVEILLGGYELTFKDMLPETIVYAEDEESLAPDLVFSVILSAEEAEAETELPEAATRSEAEVSSDDAQEAPGEAVVPIFTMIVEEDVGDHVVVLKDEAGHIVPVALNMAQMPEGLSDKHQNEFIVAQLDVHVLRATLAVKSIPTPLAEEETDQPDAALNAGEYELTYTAPKEAGLNVREEDGAFVFYAAIGGKDVTVFTLTLGSEEGNIVFMAANPAGERIPVGIVMAQMPGGLSDSDASAYYTAQEAVSQVMATLTLQ